MQRANTLRTWLFPKVWVDGIFWSTLFLCFFVCILRSGTVHCMSRGFILAEISVRSPWNVWFSLSSNTFSGSKYPTTKEDFENRVTVHNLGIDCKGSLMSSSDLTAVWVSRLLPGPLNRREGGQGIVVFADSKSNNHMWAIKFFLSQRHFTEERSMYQNAALSSVLPKVRLPCYRSQCSHVHRH